MIIFCYLGVAQSPQSIHCQAPNAQIYLNECISEAVVYCTFCLYSSGTGAAQAHAVFQALNKWKIADNVMGLCFDTTSFNAGRKSGACILLEHLLGRDLLYLACRHHILELVAGSAFTEMMGASSAPEILLFKRFQTKWKCVNQAKFEDSSTSKLTADAVADVKENMRAFLTSALVADQTRDA